MPTHRTPKKGKGVKAPPIEAVCVIQQSVPLDESSDEIQHEEYIELPSPIVSPIVENIVQENQQPRESLSRFSQEIEKKFEDMRQEFQLQMLEMKNLFVSRIGRTSAPDEHGNTSEVELRANCDNQSKETVVDAGLSPTLAQPKDTAQKEDLRGEFDLPPIFLPRSRNIYPLPEFSGSPEEWAIFIEDFQVTSREFGYSNLQNILRLRESLKGRARDCVEALLHNSANVQDIIDILRETFGRPDQLINSQIQKVRYILPILENDLPGLVDFANKVINMATFLKNTKAFNHLSNPSLLSELSSKLPHSRQIQWAEKCVLLQNPPTVLDFSSWINSVRKVANIVTDTISAENIEQHRIGIKTKNIHQMHLNILKCFICEGNCKQLEECSEFLKMDVSSRIEKTKSLKLCFCCLKKGHQVAKCFSKSTCSICGKKHHLLIHVDSINNTYPNSRQSCHLETYCDSVLFQIIPVNLYAKNKKITAYAFVDDGANASIVDKELIRNLGITGNKDILELKWLNQHSTQCECEVVQIEISGVHNNAKKYTMSNVYTIENLSLPTQSLQKCDVLQKDSPICKIPVKYYKKVQPRIIISLSHAYLTTPLHAPISTKNFGPIAINTWLGWIVYGPTKSDGKFKSDKKRSLVIDKTPNESNYEFSIENMMKGYFDMETFGVKTEIKPLIRR